MCTHITHFHDRIQKERPKGGLHLRQKLAVFFWHAREGGVSVAEWSVLTESGFFFE